MTSKNPVSLSRSARGKSLAKMAMAAVMALVFAALMATTASAAPKYSLSITKGEGGSATLTPLGLTTDSSGNLYVANKAKSQVEKFSSTGTYLAKFGPIVGEVTDVAIDSSGNVWVSNYTAGQVLEYSSAGVLLRKLTKGEKPIALTAGASGTVWYLTRQMALQMNSSGSEIAVLGGGSEFHVATDIDAEAAGQLWVASGTTSSSLFNKGYRYTPSKLQSSWALPAAGGGIAADGSGNAWIGEPGLCRVTKYGPTGTSLESFGECGSGAGKLGSMTVERPGLAFGPGGVIWVSNGTEIQKWS